MKKVKILAVIPYTGLKEVFSYVMSERDDVEIHLYEGNLADGMHIAQRLKNENYDAVISRGGTAVLIEQVVGIPVVDLRVTPYDMIRIIKMLGNINGKIAIVGFANIANCARIVSELLEYYIDTYTIEKEEDVNEIFNKLKAEKYDVIIGDVITFTSAQRLGMNSVLLTSGRESVNDAIDRAVMIYNIRQNERQKTEFFQQLINEDNRYVCVRNEAGEELYSNADSEETGSFMSTLGKLDADVLGAGKYDTEITCGGEVWGVRGRVIPVQDEMRCIAYYCQKLRQAEQLPDYKAVSYVTVKQSAVITHFYWDINKSDEIHEQIRSFSSSNLPILIVGERGLGKENLAYTIRASGKNSSQPIIRIDSSRFTVDECSRFITGEVYNTYCKDGVMLLLYDVDKMAPDAQAILADYLERESARQQIRLISTTSCNLEKLVESETFNERLYNIISALHLYVPPIREQIENMDGAISLMISWLSMELGVQVVGLKPDAMHLIKDYDWYGNLEQLTRVLRELLLKSAGSYITAQEVNAVLESEEKVRSMSVIGTNFIKGTLNDITRKVIRIVLEQENMNQTSAAKRLGISRGTLWRWLK